MKTKKSGVRGSVITSADIEKATKAIGLYLEKLKNNINICAADCTFVLGSGTPLDVALIPFDVVANGGTLRIKKEVLDRFCATWIKFAWGLKCDGAMEFVLSLFRLLDMFSKSGSTNFNHGVFVADYGYFRGSLTTCLYWNTSRLAGYSSGVNADLENLEDGQNRRDMKIREVSLATKGINGKRQVKDWQESKVVGLLQGKIKKGDPIKKVRKVCLECCRAVLNKAEYRKFENGKEVDMSLGYESHGKKIYSFQAKVLRGLGYRK